MNYLNQLNEKISLFQLISYINTASLFLNFAVSIIFRKTMGAKGSLVGDYKKLFESEDEESGVALVRLSTGMILIVVCSVIISIISCWLGSEFFLKVNTVVLTIIPAIDCLPLLINCNLYGQSYKQDSYFLMVVFIRTLFVNIAITIATLCGNEFGLDTTLFDANSNQVYKILIIAFLIVLVYGVVYTIANSLYSIWAYMIPSEIPEKMHQKIKEYLSRQEKMKNGLLMELKALIMIQECTHINYTKYV